METQHGLNLQRSRLERAPGYRTTHSGTNTTITYSTTANSAASKTSVTYDNDNRYRKPTAVNTRLT